MSNLREAAEKALIQLQGDDAYLGHRSKKRADAIEALRQALAQPVDLAKVGEVGVWGEDREWVGLTDEEIAEGQSGSWVDKQAWESAVWWAEAKLKEKNA